MTSEDELKKILREAIKKAGNNISQWARENDVFSQRGNISEMAYGDKKISEKIAEKLGYQKNPKKWELIEPTAKK